MKPPTQHAALITALFIGTLPTARAQTSPAPPAPAASAAQLPAVSVTGRRGSFADDYRVDALDALGPFGSTRLLDTPFTIGIVPQELIENAQAKNFKEVAKYLPLVSLQEQQGPQILRPQTRGMQGGNFQNSRMDGMTMYVTVANAMEQFQQIEVVNGVSAALYGPANPSGMFNFVAKRPTDGDLRRATLSYDSAALGTLHLDLGGRAGADGWLAYRVNLLGSNGEGYVDQSQLKRTLGSVALDLHPQRGTVVELNYSDYRLVQRGYPGWFTYGQAIVLPAAPDPTRVGYGQPDAGVVMQTNMGSVKLKQQINADWRLVLGLLDQDARRDISTPVNNLRSNAGNYVASLANGFAPRFVITSDVGYLNGTFSAGGIAHDLTIGFAGYKSQSFAVTTPASAASVLLGSATIDAPVPFALPAAGLPNTTNNYAASTIYQQGLNISDLVRFNPAWFVRLGVSQDWFRVANVNARGVGLPGYRDSGASPSVALGFKPRDDVTTYVSWASSLQAGDLAPGTAANASVGLAPYRSRQVEAGVKLALAKLDVAAALFRIERPFANVDAADNVFKISGQQVNTGLEFSAVGEVAPGLTVYGGLTVLDARLQRTGNVATDGKRFVGAAKLKGNVLLEYRVPGVSGLVASVDWQHSGSRPGNDVNSFDVAGYDLFDLGARYDTLLWDRRTTWRAAVNNVTDRHYWSTIAPATITGANSGNLVAHLGSPRTVSASVSVNF